MSDYTLEDVLVGTTEQTLSITETDKTVGKSVFVINKGPGVVTFRVYGSPTGILRENFVGKGGVYKYTTVEEALHYIIIDTTVVAASGNAYIDLSAFVYDFIKITAQSTIADTTVNSKLQQAYTNQ